MLHARHGTEGTVGPYTAPGRDLACCQPTQSSLRDHGSTHGTATTSMRQCHNYSEETEFSSPWVVTINGDESGTLRGKAALRAFWEKCLALAPGARLELLYVLTGVDTITLVYRHHGRLQLIEAETMAFQEDGRVVRTILHYCEHPPRAT